ncbi:response regulator [Rubellicoccus peritrichatus]|uniref:Response regulator n=1 Tax=Rubellicoccus peritrichatus TaxID=3080537 RepID=A0AAQ3LEP5_9BACT|nr:response regulator [Puniceicoccus sp. CR14]WOO42253.1 response regulator [Puniceicoccus sp. CR14]
MSDYRRRKILLIEDDPRDVKWLTGLLKMERINAVLAVDDVDTALKLCSKHHIDCILLDLGLPGVRGMDFMRMLKSIPGYTAAPVIMLTGQEVEITAAEAMKLGTRHYMSKSFINQEKLLRVVQEVTSTNKVVRKKEVNLSKLEEHNQRLLQKLAEIDARLSQTEGRLEAVSNALSKAPGGDIAQLDELKSA